MRRSAEEVMRATHPRSVDVGRYELVADATAMAALVERSLVAALDMDLVLGKRVNYDGTSFAAPPEQTLGIMPIASPVLTLRADRSLAGGLMTVGWDDEGVRPDDFPLIEHGIVSDYLTGREDAAGLGWWYTKRGQATRSHGCAVSWGGHPFPFIPNFSIDPSTADTSVDDLIKDVKKGVYLSGYVGVSADFGMLNVYARSDAVQEIRNGKLVGYLKNVGLQFQAKTFWKGLIALGGARSRQRVALGNPARLLYTYTVRSVPARFREVNVVNTGRTQ
jgi:TldD protein